MRALVKMTIVTLTLWGWLPYSVADFLIQKGGLSDA